MMKENNISMGKTKRISHLHSSLERCLGEGWEAELLNATKVIKSKHSDKSAVWNFDHILTSSRLSIKFALNQRVELATS